jgi:hypothetical protein
MMGSMRMFGSARLAAAALAAVLGAGLLAGAGSARAQEFGLDDDGGRYEDDGGRFEDRGERRWGDEDRGPRRYSRARLLPPRAIVGSLYRRGYRDVEIKRVRGGSYIVEAQSRRGSRVVAVVDGRTTEITGLRVIEHRRPRRTFDDGGWNGPSPWSGPRW